MTTTGTSWGRYAGGLIGYHGWLIGLAGACMTMARALGYGRTEAARIALLMSIPTILASGALLSLDLLDDSGGAVLRDGAIAAGFLDEAVELDSGVSMGVFSMRERLSDVPEEREYQEQLHHASYRLPEALHGKWVQFGLTPNLGLDLYPELLDLFEVTPLDVNLTRVTMRYFGHRNPTPKDRLLRRLNLKINQPVNDEDKELCERVQLGLKTTGYVPGPLSQIESSVHCFHDMVRKLIPAAALADAPAPGAVAKENQRMMGLSHS